MMPELKLVIFDCDGVMFDSLEANRQFYNQLLKRFGHPPMDDAELEYVHSHNVMDSVQYIFRHYEPPELEQAHAYRQQLDYIDFIRYMKMEPDLKEFLAFLKPAYYTAISTNRTTTLPIILKMFGLESLFDKVVTAFDVARPKPYPDALYAILDYFGTTVEETVYIGDSMVDRQHTDSIGMRLIAFKNPYLPAEYHVSSFMAITELPLFQD